MNALASLPSILLFGLQVALVLIVPWIVARFGAKALHRIVPIGFFDVPVVIGASRVLGVLLAALLLAARADRFDPRHLFGPESPWNLSAWEFIAKPANPFWMAAGFAGDSAGRVLGMPVADVAAIAGLFLLAVFLAPLAFWERPASLRAVVGAIGTAAITGYVVVYGVALFFWLLFFLNFWVLGVFLVILQWYRSRVH